MATKSPAHAARAGARRSHERTRDLRWALAVCAALAALNLLFGMAGGLARLGLPGPAGNALALHGMLMVSGVFGTLIALERAAAMRRTVALAVPLASGVAGVLAWAGAPMEWCLWLWLAAGAGLFALYLWAGRTRAWSVPLTIEMLGAACWWVGTLLWLQGGLAHQALPAWMAFLVLTIAGERRELMQLVKLSPAARRWFKLALLLLPAAVLLAVLDGVGVLPQTGRVSLAWQVWWAGCVLLASWLLRFDFAPRQWRAEGWRGVTAQALSVGYGWLLVSGLLGLMEHWWPMAAQGPAWHALLLGFVFSMVIGHAPIMLPALARVHPVYSPAARWPVWLLSASLVLRIAAAGFAHPTAMAAAGIGHALAIVLFAAVILRAVLASRRAAG